MKKIKFIPIIAVLALVVSCYGDPDTDSLSSDLVVATDRDLQAEFQDFATYYISDTIPKITDDRNDTILVGAEALEIVNKIKENLNNRGFTFVEKDQNPDMGIVPAILTVTNVNAGCTGWWGGYPGWWGGPYWGYPGYNYYYPYCGYYSYDTGTISLDMIDLIHVDSSENLNLLWTGTMFGLLSSSDAVNLDRSLDAIDQAFIQSPYIQN